MHLVKIIAGSYREYSHEDRLNNFLLISQKIIGCKIINIMSSMDAEGNSKTVVHFSVPEIELEAVLDILPGNLRELIELNGVI